MTPVTDEDILNDIIARLAKGAVRPVRQGTRHRPKRLILDFDATGVPPHGEQEGRFFYGYYDLPQYVFCVGACWRLICAAATSTRRGTARRSSRCW